MRPGDVVPASDDDRPAIALVVATSRHQGEVTLEEAYDALAAAAALQLIGRDVDAAPLRAAIAGQTPTTWRSVTATEDHACYAEVCDSEPGSWCTDGAGRAWVKVVTVTHEQVYDLLDDPDTVAA